MPSRSLLMWRGSSALALDEIESAHRAIGGSGRGRRFATQQINHAYAVLLSSQFQRFCRDLHTEAVNALAATMTSPMRLIFRQDLTFGRKLDTGNPTPGNIGSDFGRIRMNFWPDVLAQSNQNARRQITLEELIRWRNAIAHQDFTSPHVGGTSALHLVRVRNWRGTCNMLAREFDSAVARYLTTILGHAPW